MHALHHSQSAYTGFSRAPSLPAQARSPVHAPIHRVRPRKHQSRQLPARSPVPGAHEARLTHQCTRHLAPSRPTPRQLQMSSLAPTEFASVGPLASARATHPPRLLTPRPHRSRQISGPSARHGSFTSARAASLPASSHRVLQLPLCSPVSTVFARGLRVHQLPPASPTPNEFAYAHCTRPSPPSLPALPACQPRLAHRCPRRLLTSHALACPPVLRLSPAAASIPVAMTLSKATGTPHTAFANPRRARQRPPH